MASLKIGKKKIRVSQIVLHFILIAMLVFMLFPLWFAFWNAFKSKTAYDLNKWTPSFPLRIANLSTAWALIGSYMYNTVIVAVVGVGGMLVISSLASFGIAKLRFYGQKLFFGSILVMMMIPSVLTLVPSYLLYRNLGMRNNLFALIIPIWSGGCVYAVFLLVTMFRGLPNDMFEAAELDGASSLQKYAYIALPLSLPILGTITIMQIINVWNDFMWPQLILESDNYTIGAGLKYVFDNTYNQNTVTVMYAGYLLASLPVVALFVFANKFYIQGLVSSSIKM
jgi:ABC-type glycerol-3-phosphate transport system permease component